MLLKRQCLVILNSKFVINHKKNDDSNLQAENSGRTVLTRTLNNKKRGVNICQSAVVSDPDIFMSGGSDL